MAFLWSEQKEELFRFETDILVSASAGTGKTTALVELFLRLLEGSTSYPKPVTVGNILAITFTNKAARQLREKVSEELAARESDGSGDADEHLYDAYIHTFHGFCGRLLRSYAFEAGVSPDFALADELERERLLERAANEELTRHLSDPLPDLRRLLVNYGFVQLSESTRAIIRSSHGAPVEPLDVPSERERLTELLHAELQSYRNLLERLQQSAEQTKLTEKTRAGIDSLLEHRLKLDDFQQVSLAKIPIGEALRFFNDWRSLFVVFKNWAKAVQPMRAPLVAHMERAKALYCQYAALPDVAALRKLASAVATRFERAKRQANRLDFDDLQRLAIRLLQDRTDIRRELQARFHVVLVDEFQDTNRIQKRLLELIRRDEAVCKTMNLPPTRFLFVGDRKQSIYRFRGADVAVFRELENDWQKTETGAQRLTFDDNFRSQSGLLGFFNRFFERMMSGSDDDPYAVNYGQGDNLRPGLGESAASSAPVEVISIQHGDSMHERRSIEARTIAARLKAIATLDEPLSIVKSGGLKRNAGYGDMAILLRRMTHAGLYEQALREAGVPYVISQSGGLYQRPEIVDLCNLLRFLLQPADSSARVAVLRSPAALLSDITLTKLLALPDERWLAQNFVLSQWQVIAEQETEDEAEQKRLCNFVELCETLRRRMPLLPVSELIEEILYQGDLLIIAGQGEEGNRRSGNVEKFLRLVRGWERSQPGFDVEALLARVKDLVRIAVREGEGVSCSDLGAVRLMTIHQSKGLEFPVVALPDLDQRFQGRQGQIFIGQGVRVGMKLIDPSEQVAYDTADSQELKAKDRQEELSEYQRLLYVAMTRAKDHLILTGYYDPKKSAKKELEKMSWFDWVMSHVQQVEPDIPLTILDTPQTREFPTQDMETETDSSTQIHSHDWSELQRLAQTMQPVERRGASLGTFSVSLLKELESCERRFHLRQLLNRSTLLWSQPQPDELLALQDPPDALQRGLLVHRYFERFSEEQAKWEQWEALLLDYGLDPQSAWAKELFTYLQRCGRFPSDAKFNKKQIQAELPFVSQLETPGGYRLRLKGRIDALCLDGQGGYLLIDYKLASYSSRRHEMARLQIQLYAMVVNGLIPNLKPERCRAAVAYILDENPWRGVDVASETLRSELKHLETLLLDLKEKSQTSFDLWPMEPQALCQREGCPYLRVCYPGEKLERAM